MVRFQDRPVSIPRYGNVSLPPLPVILETLSSFYAIYGAVVFSRSGIEVVRSSRTIIEFTGGRAAGGPLKTQR